MTQIGGAADLLLDSTASDINNARSGFNAGNAPLDTWQQFAFEQFREIGVNFRVAWDVYIKFYTVFLTANVLGIGVTLERVSDVNHRELVAIAFIVQNVLGVGTALGLAWFSRSCRQRLEYIAELLSSDRPSSVVLRMIRESPVPGTLAMWAGVANSIAHVSLIAVWITVARP